MNRPNITAENTDTLYDARFLKMYDLRYREGKHYFNTSRRAKEDLVALKSDEEFQKMLPDAVSIAVVLKLKDGTTRLLLSYEYRYPTGQFLLSPVAGLIDKEDKLTENPLVSAAVREIKEESGLSVGPEDRVKVLNPCAFSTPGMTDESNAFLCAEVYVEDLSVLSQAGAVGSELFDGFELLDKAAARRIYEAGRDDKGNFYSLATWAVLGYYLMNY